MADEYCRSCGIWVPSGQGGICSRCYGDPYYGRDGYLLQELEAEEEQWLAEMEWEEQQMLEEDDE